MVWALATKSGSQDWALMAKSGLLKVVESPESLYSTSSLSNEDLGPTQEHPVLEPGSIDAFGYECNNVISHTCFLL